jgi:hypothetical protein
MSAPHVSGVASLLYMRNPALTPAQVLGTLQDTATPFPAGSTCTTATCGSGIVNAGATHTATATAIPPTPTHTATHTATATPIPPSPTHTATHTATPITPTPTPMHTATHTATATQLPPSPTHTATHTASPITPTPTPTPEISNPIGTGGGTVTFDEEKIEIDVPQGTLGSETQFTYLPQSIPTNSSGTLLFAGVSFQLTAHETGSGERVTAFDPPLEVTIHYAPAALGEIMADSLRLYFWDDAADSWRDVVTTCAGGDYERDFEAHWFRVPLCHLSEFAVFGYRPPAGPGFSIYFPLFTR